MKRRSKAAGEANKGRRRKTPEPRRRNPPKRVSSSTPILETEVARLTRELNEAREQQTATTDVLQVISSFAGELDPVFQAILTNATRICEAEHGTLFLFSDGTFQPVAAHGASAALPFERLRVEPAPGTGLGRMVNTKAAIQIADVLTDEDFPRDHPLRSAAERRGVRTLLCVPMIKEGELIGAISIFRREVRPFTYKPVELVKNFAAQAVIAIENARLLNELRQSLEQQTATSEVLQVISSSPGDLQPVFTTMLEKAVRISDAKFGTLYLYEEGGLRLIAAHDVPAAFEEVRGGGPIPPAPGGLFDEVIKTGTTVHVPDMAATTPYAEGHPRVVEAVELGGIRTVVAVPMLKENEIVGIFSVHRREVRPFTDRQIALVTNFAAQAVIAIENARLLNELRQRTTDVTEALEQQTATSEVLRVISSSRGQLDPVFQTILANATRICDANFGILNLHDEGSWPVAAMHNVPVAFVELRQREPMLHFGPDHPLERVAATKEVLHIADVRMTAGYQDGDQAHVTMVDVAGARTVLLVPMLKENELIGAITIYRQEVRPFTDKQIELVQNFAAQAVIAIENARLLNELRERTTDLAEALEQQTATSEVLRIISASRGTLEPVFQAMLENATRICGAAFGSMLLCDGEAYRRVALHNAPQKFSEFSNNTPVLRRGTAPSADRTIDTKKVVHIFDLAAEEPEAPIAKLGGARTLLSAPMLKENEAIGVIGIYRQEVRPFTDKQIALLTNFAAQAVIAIENARLLNELRERTEDVVKLNQQLEVRVADQVDEIERMSRLRRFLPPQVADLIVASGSEKQLESHRREITALFCDLRGFTGFTESADAEDVMALLRDYHAAIGELVIRYSGTLERYAGDGVMVVFNDPVPVENPALQAVLMALELRSALEALTQTWSRLGHEIGFGIGIAHGFATLGTIGFEGRFDYAAIGTVSNVASRLCDEAKPGQILISPRVLTKVENAVTVEPVGEFELKGIRRPLAAYNVVDLVSAKTLDAQS